jgi:hypothetical protein
MHLVVIYPLSSTQVLSPLFFFLDSEIVKPVLDPTLRILKTYAPKILSIEVDRLLQEVKTKNIFFFIKSKILSLK